MKTQRKPKALSANSSHVRFPNRLTRRKTRKRWVCVSLCVRRKRRKEEMMCFLRLSSHLKFYTSFPHRSWIIYLLAFAAPFLPLLSSPRTTFTTLVWRHVEGENWSTEKTAWISSSISLFNTLDKQHTSRSNYFLMHKLELRIVSRIHLIHNAWKFRALC